MNRPNEGSCRLILTIRNGAPSATTVGKCYARLRFLLGSLAYGLKPYLEEIIGILKWRLNNSSAEVREHAADLISGIAAVMTACNEEVLLGQMGTVLFEYLGEEFPDVLGSI